MADDLLLRGGRIIDVAQGIDLVGDLYIVDGAISAIIPQGEQGPDTGPRGLTTLDVPGCVISPGFIDLHCHLREPGYEEKETIATGSKAAAHGGFTSICCMANTNPPADNRSVIELIIQIAKNTAPVRVYPVAAVTKQLAGQELTEMSDLIDAGAIAFSDDGKPVVNPRVMRSALEYAKMFDRPIMPHCEVPELVDGGQMNEGPVANRLGLRGWPASGEDTMLARDLQLAELTGGRLHAAHVSTAGGVQLVRDAKARGVRVTAEATPHHLALTDEWVAGVRWDGRIAPPYDTNTKVNPPLRSEADRRALLSGLKDGTIDAIATDHAPHTVVDKQCEYDFAANGISGIETALGTLLRLVRNEELDLKLVLGKLTIGPATAFGLRSGSLRPGMPADVTVFGPNLRWTVDPNEFVSKGKNTPLAGMPMVGKVLLTIVGGEVVYNARA